MIKNVIFDLGNVLINLKVGATKAKFSEITHIPEGDIKVAVRESTFFNEYETGKITSEEFRERVNTLLDCNLSNENIDLAWNVILGDFKKEMIDLINELREKDIKVFLLSNTNSIHANFFENKFLSLNLGEFRDFFDGCYYSYEMKMRKPESQIFEALLKNENLKADECLFVDDLLENIQAANEVGLKGLHFTCDSNAQSVRGLLP